MKTKRVFQFEIIINVLVSLNTYVIESTAIIIFIISVAPSLDVKIWRL